MDKKLYMFLFFSTLFFISYGQTIVVNSDGTHSVGISHGSTSTVINPNGTHSIGVNHGSTTTVINPDGTHSIGINHGSTTSILNPDGTHSVGNNRHHSSNDTNQHTSSFVGSTIIDKQTYEDSLFEKNSTQYSEEILKYRILRRRGLLKRKEYQILKKQIRNDRSFVDVNKANQIFTLSQQLNSNQITFENFLSQKREIIESTYNSQ